MKTWLEKSLIECLKWAKIPSLPEEDDNENIWIKAIALVEKKDGTESYVAVTKDDNLENKIVKDFGSVSIVHSVKTYYPYLYLSAAFVPEFKTRKKEERIAYLSKCYRDMDFSGMSLKELDKLIIQRAIKQQREQYDQEHLKTNDND